MKEAVGVFTSLRHKQVGIAHPDISSDGRKDPAYGDGGVQVACQQDLGKHRGCSGLSVSAGNGDRDLVVGHQLSQKLRPA